MSKHKGRKQAQNRGVKKQIEQMRVQRELQIAFKRTVIAKIQAAQDKKPEKKEAE